MESCTTAWGRPWSPSSLRHRILPSWAPISWGLPKESHAQTKVAYGKMMQDAHFTSLSLACTTSLHDLASSSRDLTLNHKATYGKGNCPVGSAPTASGWKLSSTNCCPRWATRKAWSSSSLSDSAAVFRTHICCAFDSWYLIDTKMTKPKIYACTLQ